MKTLNFINFGLKLSLLWRLELRLKAEGRF